VLRIWSGACIFVLRYPRCAGDACGAVEYTCGVGFQPLAIQVPQRSPGVQLAAPLLEICMHQGAASMQMSTDDSPFHQPSEYGTTYDWEATLAAHAGFVSRETG
jgi:hypothetical protein